MTPNPYNTSQWHWIADRLSEGYRLHEIADFLGMHYPNVRYNLIAIGRYRPLEDRVPLDERKREFNSLAGDGSPPVNNYLKPVIGTDRDGNEVYFDSISEAERSLGIPRGSVGHAIKNGYRCHGYKWRYAINEN